MFVYRNDLYIPELDLWLDPLKPRRRAFVSHAHGDHIGRHEESIATPETARLVRHRLGELSFRELQFGESLDLGRGAEIRLHPAGHILGAAQIEIRRAGQVFVYTGDFRLEPSQTAEKCAVVPCDTLVMECTFGHPKYVFPPREEVVPQLAERLRQWIDDGSTPVLLAYSLGRSQELLKVLEPYGLDLCIAPSIHAVVKVYEELGVRFGPYRVAKPGGTDGAVLFVPPYASRSRWVRHARKPVLVAATGWTMNESGPPYRAEHCFPFSDHADFDELVRYAIESKAREVYTIRGTEDFHEHLRERGVTAFPAKTRVAMR